jgi:hypothetical protein
MVLLLLPLLDEEGGNRLLKECMGVGTAGIELRELLLLSGRSWENTLPTEKPLLGGWAAQPVEPADAAPAPALTLVLQGPAVELVHLLLGGMLLPVLLGGMLLPVLLGGMLLPVLLIS